MSQRHSPWGRWLPVFLLLLAAAPVWAQAPVNLVLTATASSSTDWNADFAAAKANDGDLTTRWNSAAGDQAGSFLAFTWDKAQTFNKVVIRQAFDRITAYHIQVMDDAAGDWKDVAASPDPINPAKDPNPVFTAFLKPAVTSTGVRLMVDEGTNVPSIFEVEAYNAPQASLKGTVKDSSGQAIEAAVVVAGGTQAVTNAQGAYELIVDPGTYDIAAFKAGVYRTKTARGVTVAADATATTDFTLLPVPVNLAPGATATDSSEWSAGYEGFLAIDGDMATRWNSAAGDLNGSWLALEWDKPQTINRVVIRQFADRIRSYSLQGFDTAKNDWVDVYSTDVPTSSGDVVLTASLGTPLVGTQLRLLIKTASTEPSIYEMEVSKVELGTLTVTAVDASTSKPVAGASVLLDTGSLVGSADASGVATLYMDPDTYVVHATAPGYLPSDPTTVTLSGSQPATATAKLIPLGENLAKKAEVTASTDDGTNVPANATDDDPATYWASDPTQTKEQWIALTWPSAVAFRKVDLSGIRGPIQKSQLEIQDDTGKWTPIPNTEFNPQFTGDKSFLFDQPITTKALRYYEFYTDHDNNVPGLASFAVYNPPVTSVEPPPALLYGDVNDDGKVTILDVIAALRAVAGLSTLTDDQIARAKVSGGAKFGITDVIFILRKVAGLITTFPVEGQIGF